MYRTISIKIKATFLLIVFSLNTVISFACFVGLYLEHNATQHQDKENVSRESVHVHADGNKHHHERKASQHQKKTKEDNCRSNKDADNCCNDQVTKFSQLDKDITQPYAISPVFYTPFVFNVYKIDVLVSSQIAKSTRYFVRGHHPPIPDILIAIQRFQI